MKRAITEMSVYQQSRTPPGRDVVEAMLAAQMVATHEAAMECFRRAALAEQTFAGREA